MLELCHNCKVFEQEQQDIISLARWTGALFGLSSIRLQLTKLG